MKIKPNIPRSLEFLDLAQPLTHHSSAKTEQSHEAILLKKIAKKPIDPSEKFDWGNRIDDIRHLSTKAITWLHRPDLPDPKKILNAEQLLALKQYTEGSRTLNKSLWSNTPLTTEQQIQHTHLTDALRELNKAGYDPPKDAVVLTGTELVYGEPSLTLPLTENIARFNYYVSSSIDPWVINAYAREDGLAFHFFSNDDKAADISRLSIHPAECEVLFSPVPNLNFDIEWGGYDERNKLFKIVVPQTTMPSSQGKTGQEQGLDTLISNQHAHRLAKILENTSYSIQDPIETVHNRLRTNLNIALNGLTPTQLAGISGESAKLLEPIKAAMKNDSAQDILTTAHGQVTNADMATELEKACIPITPEKITNIVKEAFEQHLNTQQLRALFVLGHNGDPQEHFQNFQTQLTEKNILHAVTPQELPELIKTIFDHIHKFLYNEIDGSNFNKALNDILKSQDPPLTEAFVTASLREKLKKTITVTTPAHIISTLEQLEKTSGQSSEASEKVAKALRRSTNDKLFKAIESNLTVMELRGFDAMLAYLNVSLAKLDTVATQLDHMSAQNKQEVLEALAKTRPNFPESLHERIDNLLDQHGYVRTITPQPLSEEENDRIQLIIEGKPITESTLLEKSLQRYQAHHTSELEQTTQQYQAWDKLFKDAQKLDLWPFKPPEEPAPKKTTTIPPPDKGSTSASAMATKPSVTNEDTITPLPGPPQNLEDNQTTTQKKKKGKFKQFFDTKLQFKKDKKPDDDSSAGGTTGTGTKPSGGSKFYRLFRTNK